MKLPNDLIKATDYSKAKEREIHEFEYVNGKYIHRYVLGGEHEMTPQEIVDCLNAIATIDCDLSTAYAYIKGQDEKIADLQHRLEVADKALENSCKRLQDYYCTTCDNQTNCSRVEMCEMCLSTYLPSDFKEQAEKELKGEKL